MIWRTKDGKEIDIKNMTSQHLYNAIKYMERANEKGIETGGGIDIDDIWYDIDHHHFDDDIKAMREELQNRMIERFLQEATV